MPVHETFPWDPHGSITQWAVASGIVGHPLSLALQDYPAPIISELYGRHATWVDEKNVFSVFGLWDLNQLRSKLDNTRLVLVFDPKLFVKACWLLEMHRNAAVKARKPSPALFGDQATVAAGDLPGAALVLHGYSPQVKSLEAWLELDAVWQSFPSFTAPPDVHFDHLLRPLIASPGNTRPELSLGLRERRILQGLLIGAALVRRVHENKADAHLSIELQDYRLVHKALQAAATQPGDEFFDPLVLAMVRRANVYLVMKANAQETKKARADAAADQGQEHCIITRREIADLGNTRGKTVKSLVAFLLKQGPEGMRRFRSIGTNRAIKEEEGWPSNDIEQLVRLLLPWGPKQTRTRFDYLHSKGLITAERTAANQPWIYQLPEALSSACSPFRSLPKPSELERRAVTA